MTEPSPLPVTPVDTAQAEFSALSVVIPTKGNPWAVQRLVESLGVAVTELPAGVQTEIVVVDDSSYQDGEQIRETCEKSGARYLRGPRRVGAKRNLGVAETRHQLVLFIDSDCIATPTLLREHLDFHNAHRGRQDIGAVAGPTVVAGDADSGPWRTVRHSLVANAPWNWPLRFEQLWWAATSNLSVRRTAFDTIGGFDEHTYTVVGGEDVDLGVRLDAAGYRTLGHPDAVVVHATDGITRLHQFRRKLFLYGRACVYNCARQPEHTRWWPNPTTVALAAGATAALLPRHRLPALLTAAAGTALWFGNDTRRTARRADTPAASAAATVSVDWSYHLGITLEAIRRGKPTLAMKRFDYFPEERFVLAAPGTSSEGQDEETR
ncbi:glycosyltransferase family 2 protein [Streptomyces sp. NPDC051740]|uniref:glycosyltransferase family 2 protein n=1 Tax=Streptomyces sp. NPDC051740 TaxID=3365673 RepID=UPI0037874BC5